VVLPPFTENLNAKTVQLLAAFGKAGGRLISCGDPPARIDGGLSPAGAALAQSPRWSRVEAKALAQELDSPGFAILRSPGDRGILFHHRRQLEDGQFLFLVNTSLEAASAGTILSDLKGVEQWNLYSGTTAPYPFEIHDKMLKAGFNLPPSGSLLLFLSRKPLRPAAPVSETLAVLHPQAPPTARRIAPNVLTLDYVEATAGGETRTNIYFYQANQFVWQKNGLERNPWDSAVQFGDELISKKFPAGSGFEASYRFHIDGGVPANLAIVIERPDLYSITCNRQPVAPGTNEWWLDKSFGRIDIASAARSGENVVTIKAAPFTMFHELESAYVLGDFSLKAASQGFVIVPPQPLDLGTGKEGFLGWNTQGLPFYSAGVAYQESFEVLKPEGRYTVALPNWYGSVAKVAVNGKAAGYIDAPPWECDVTKWVKRGKNRVEVTVIGTLKNTLGPHHGNPALGSAWPGSFQKATNPGPPPGEKYSTVAYGLFEPFVLNQTTPGP
jgi:hypothetical protein